MLTEEGAPISNVLNLEVEKALKVYQEGRDGVDQVLLWSTITRNGTK